MKKNHEDSPQESLPNAESARADESVVAGQHDRLLGELLQEIVQITSADNSATATEEISQRLASVSAGFPDDTVCTPAVVEALVAAVTEDIPLLGDGVRAAMNQAVAESLYGDVETRGRVEALWTSLRQIR